ncbi:extracellular solute-binding protein [Nonomuraea spiralis]|uniref:Extracellular solute-binding protein n=1 Tax=Nonomuraea spiralis TaxID=46182 RepID=A0ABV5IUV3_9ACTN|nr:extracellular solute-binding protein [Nonomuraea spiralis]GGT45693.1 sugar ABC transporter substrate-binding protein [Nonomuraea spiralis]
MNTYMARGAAGLLLLAAVAACGGGQDGTSGGKTEITVSGMPPSTQPESQKNFLAQVAEFEKANPTIKVKPTETQYDVKTFAARLAAGQLETVFRVPLTDPQAMIKRGQVADLTADMKLLAKSDFDKRILAPSSTPDGKIYGLPTEAYAAGLVYNRELFTKAGLDPDKPPATWDEVRAAAKTISDKTGVPGFGMHATANTGGWMLTTMTYSYGGRMEKEEGGKVVPAFDDVPTRQALDLLKAMRWDDRSMGTQHLRNQDDLLRDFAAGKVAMMMGAPNLYGSYIAKFNGKPEVYGQTTLPSGSGKGTLLGGTVAVVSPKATPEQRQAAVKWIDAVYLRPKYDAALATERAEKKKADGLVAAVPQLPFFAPAVSDPVMAAEKAASNVDWEHFATYNEGVKAQEFISEPPLAGQELYAALDTVVQAVLTRQDADPAAEITKAVEKVKPILDRSQQ